MAYEHFYQYYDQMMEDIPYTQYTAVVKAYCKKGDKLLDLGCGTGNNLITLLKEGYDVDGLDISDDMLLVTSDKLEKHQLSANLFQDDMRDLKIKAAYHLIFSFLDTINYLPDSTAITETFKGVSDALTEDGTFIFDVHTYDTLNTTFDGYLYHEAFDDFTYLWDTTVEINNDHKVLYHDLSFYINKEKNLFSRVDETHRQVVYPLEHYITILYDSNLTVEKILYDFKEDNSDGNCRKYILICKKYKS